MKDPLEMAMHVVTRPETLAALVAFALFASFVSYLARTKAKKRASPLFPAAAIPKPRPAPKKGKKAEADEEAEEGDEDIVIEE